VKKFIALAVAALGCALATGAAHAGNNVYWSVGINLPPVGTVVSNAPVYVDPAPVYVPAPVVYAPPPPVYVPAPVVYAPAPPVVVVPRRVHYRPVPVYAPRPVVVRPVPVVYAPREGGWYDRYGRWNDERRYKH
jgi:hypothetical protein